MREQVNTYIVKTRYKFEDEGWETKLVHTTAHDTAQGITRENPPGTLRPLSGSLSGRLPM